MIDSSRFEKENIALKKLVHSNELAFIKEKALMVQQIEHLHERMKVMEKRESKLRSNQKTLTMFIEKMDIKGQFNKRDSTSLVKMMKKAFRDGSSLIYYDEDDDRRTIITRRGNAKGNDKRSLSKVLNNSFGGYSERLFEEDGDRTNRDTTGVPYNCRNTENKFRQPNQGPCSGYPGRFNNNKNECEAATGGENYYKKGQIFGRNQTSPFVEFPGYTGNSCGGNNYQNSLGAYTRESNNPKQSTGDQRHSGIPGCWRGDSYAGNKGNYGGQRAWSPRNSGPGVLSESKTSYGNVHFQGRDGPGEGFNERNNTSMNVRESRKYYKSKEFRNYSNGPGGETLKLIEGLGTPNSGNSRSVSKSGRHGHHNNRGTTTNSRGDFRDTDNGCDVVYEERSTGPDNRESYRFTKGNRSIRESIVEHEGVGYMPEPTKITKGKIGFESLVSQEIQETFDPRELNTSPGCGNCDHISPRIDKKSFKSDQFFTLGNKRLQNSTSSKTDKNTSSANSKFNSDFVGKNYLPDDQRIATQPSGRKSYSVSHNHLSPKGGQLSNDDPMMFGKVSDHKKFSETDYNNKWISPASFTRKNENNQTNKSVSITTTPKCAPEILDPNALFRGSFNINHELHPTNLQNSTQGTEHKPQSSNFMYADDTRNYYSVGNPFETAGSEE
jgi:hypothetical protein